MLLEFHETGNHRLGSEQLHRTHGSFPRLFRRPARVWRRLLGASQNFQTCASSKALRTSNNYTLLIVHITVCYLYINYTNKGTFYCSKNKQTNSAPPQTHVTFFKNCQTKFDLVVSLFSDFFVFTSFSKV